MNSVALLLVAAPVPGQNPSNMVLTSLAPTKNYPIEDTLDEDNSKIIMQDLDNYKFSPPLEDIMRVLKSPGFGALQRVAPIVVVTAVGLNRDSEDKIDS